MSVFWFHWPLELQFGSFVFGFALNAIENKINKTFTMPKETQKKKQNLNDEKSGYMFFSYSFSLHVHSDDDDDDLHFLASERMDLREAQQSKTNENKERATTGIGIFCRREQTSTENTMRSFWRRYNTGRDATIHWNSLARRMHFHCRRHRWRCCCFVLSGLCFLRNETRDEKKNSYKETLFFPANATIETEPSPKGLRARHRNLTLNGTHHS